MDGYSAKVEGQMVRLYRSLNERDRRRYAAVEADRLGHGGVEYMARLFGCDLKTIRRGIAEFQSHEELTSERQRKKGGRKPLTESHPQLVENFLNVLRDHTAGDPMRADVKWTNLSRRQISRRLQELGTPAGKNVVSRLLWEHGYRRRQPQKKRTMGQHADRNAQFEGSSAFLMISIPEGRQTPTETNVLSKSSSSFHRK